MAACIRRNRSLLKWLALLLTMSSVLVWFGVTVGISSRDRSARASEGIGRTRWMYSENQREVTSVFSQLAHNVNEIDPETASRVLKSMETPNNTALARTEPVLPSMKVHQDNHFTQQENKPITNPESNISHKNSRSNATKHSFHPPRRKINSVQDSRGSKHDLSSTSASATRTRGYVTALEFWDQQTFSIQNILSLQVWAGWLGVGVLEPFLVGTKFGLPLGDHESFHRNGSVSYLAMGDVYDMEQWNLETSKYHYEMSPFTPWKDFLADAPRDVPFFNLGRFTGRNNIEKEVTNYNRTLAKLGFRLVEARYLQLDWHKPVTETDLKAELYKGGKSPGEFTVIFGCWNRQELTHVFRALQFNMLFGSSVVSLEPSRRLKEDATQYRLRHLSSNGSYIGVLVRAEWLIMNRGPDNRKYVLNGCLNRALGWLHSLRNQTGLADVFVGMDIGRFGSTTLRDLRMEYIQRLGEDFLRAAYRDPRVTLRNWEETFTAVSSSSVPGYVAFLQKSVAANGRCLILIGFGSFQRHALQMYMKLHRKQDYCYLKTDSQCRVKLVVGFDP